MKKILSVILSALILACPLCSLAAEAAQTLDWYFCFDDEYCEPWYYSPQGEVVLGENEITFAEDEYCVYYTFNAENSGYYYVECLDDEIEWLAFPEIIRNGDAYRVATCDYITDEENKIVFKLNAGETVLGIDFNGFADTDETCSVTIEYLGDSITDLTVDDGALDNLIIDVDLHSTDISYISSDVDVVFSGGKTMTFVDKYIPVNAEDFEWVKGANDATLYFIGYEKDVIVNACEITDIFTDVEFVNLEDYKNVNTSYNDSYFEDIYGAELVFTLADGTKLEVEVDYFHRLELNGREYYIYTYYEYNSPEDVDIIVSVSGIRLATYECNVTKTTLAENTKYLFEDIGENIKDSMYYSRLGFSELLRFYDVSDIEYTLIRALSYFEEAIYYFRNTIYDVKDFFEFYM